MLRSHSHMYVLTCILNAINYAPHILLMTAEVNESQFPKFSFQFIWHWSHNNTFKRKLFCRIPVFFTILWDLSRGYKTKVITLPPNISTITSNEEKNMNLSMEILNSFNTYSSRLNFLWKFIFFGWKMRCLQSLKVIFVKNSKFHWKAVLWVSKLHTKFQGNISTNNIAIAN